MTAIEQVEERRTSLPIQLTVEQAGYLGVLLFAGLWRLLQLGLYPLGAEEVRQTLAAWDAAQGWPVALWGLSPLLFALQEGTFLLTLGGDALARFWPALAGVAICLIPYALRRRLGPAAALMAAALLALSPTLTYFARYASGDVMAAAAILVALAAGWAAFRDSRWLPWASVALVLALLSGPGVYTALLALGIAGALWARAEIAAAWATWREQGAIHPTWRAAGLVFLLVATAGLRHWDGIGAAAGVLGTWAARWSTPDTGYPLYWPLLRLLLDEPLLLGFGVYGAIVGVRSGDRLIKALALWGGLALLWPMVTPGRQPQDLVIAIPPLALLAGQGIVAFARQVELRPIRLEAGVVLATLSILLGTLYIWIVGYSRLGTREYIAAAFAPLALMIGLLLFFGFWAGWRSMRQVLVLFLAGVALLWTLSASWINAHGVDLDRRPAVQFEMTSPEVRMLVDSLTRLSERRVGDPYLLPVEIMDSPQAPILRWYLRRMNNLRIVGAPMRGEAAPVVITPLLEEAAPGDRYGGRDFVVTTRWTPEGLRGPTLIRWLLLRQGMTPAEERRAILWVVQQAAIGDETSG